MALDGQEGNVLQLRNKLGQRSQVKIQCCQMSKKRSRFVFLLLDSVDLFVLELQVGEKMTENTVNSRLADTSL